MLVEVLPVWQAPIGRADARAGVLLGLVRGRGARVGGRVEGRPHRGGERGVDVARHVPVQVSGQSRAAAQPGGEAASLRKVESGVEVFLSLRPQFLLAEVFCELMEVFQLGLELEVF